MGWTTLLTGKTKVSVEEFCGGFYAESGFESVLSPGPLETYSDVLYDSLVEADSNFAQIKREALREELIILRMLIFLLALGHRFGDPKLLLRGFLFTKSYMKDFGRESTWETLVHYNKVIAVSAVDFIVATQSERWARGKSEFVNSMRFELFKKYKAGADDETTCCAAQTVGQLFTEPAWKSEYTLKCLVAHCVFRLGWVTVHGETLKPQPDALLRLAVVLLGFYDGAQCAMKSVALK